MLQTLLLHSYIKPSSFTRFPPIPYVGYKLTPTKPNRQGWVQTVSIHNNHPAGAIYETAGRKSGMGGRFTPRLPGQLAGSGKMAGRAMFKAYKEDEGKAKAGVIKALEPLSLSLMGE